MPAFDGTGPLGLGPMTGRGEGYCALVLPSPGAAATPYGYAGLQGRPVASPVAATAYLPFSGWPRLGMRFGRGFVRGRGHGRGWGGRGRRW